MFQLTKEEFANLKSQFATSSDKEGSKAHQENDRAVMAAYGFVPGKTTESECVAKLFERYQELAK